MPVATLCPGPRCYLASWPALPTRAPSGATACPATASCPCFSRRRRWPACTATTSTCRWLTCASASRCSIGSWSESALPRSSRLRLPRVALLVGALLLAASIAGVAVLLGVFASETVKRIEIEQQAGAVDASNAPNVPDETRALIARHTPELAMAVTDYDPIDARIFL